MSDKFMADEELERLVTNKTLVRIVCAGNAFVRMRISDYDDVRIKASNSSEEWWVFPWKKIDCLGEDVVFPCKTKSKGVKK